MNTKRVKRIGGWRAMVIALLVSISSVTILPVNAFAAPTQGTQPAGVKIHIVRPGDTLWTIAKLYKVSVESLKRYNRISNPHQIYIGQKIYIPPSQ